jgi:hypothetical protein
LWLYGRGSSPGQEAINCPPDKHRTSGYLKGAASTGYAGLQRMRHAARPSLGMTGVLLQDAMRDTCGTSRLKGLRRSPCGGNPTHRACWHRRPDFLSAHIECPVAPLQGGVGLHESGVPHRAVPCGWLVCGLSLLPRGRSLSLVLKGPVLRVAACGNRRPGNWGGEPCGKRVQQFHSCMAVAGPVLCMDRFRRPLERAWCYAPRPDAAYTVLANQLPLKLV